MEKRNLTPLRNVLVRYLVVCGGGSIVILLVWWGLFMSLIRNGFLLPPVTGAQVCSEALVSLSLCLSAADGRYDLGHDGRSRHR